MNKTHYVFIALFCLCLLCGQNSKAAFVVRKAATEVVTASAQPTQAITETPAPVTNGHYVKSAKKQSLVSSLLRKLVKPSAEMSKGLYIVLAIIGFGWLAMGINDNFSGSDWLISLLLYIILWLPGLIYTLIKMKKYYK